MIAVPGLPASRATRRIPARGLLHLGLGLLLSLAALMPGRAHEIRPAYLELRERTRTTLEGLWKVPLTPEGQRPDLSLGFPEDSRDATPPQRVLTEDASVDRFVLEREAGWEGVRIELRGLAETGTDALVRRVLADGQVETLRVQPANPSVVWTGTAGGHPSVRAYLALGFEHILLGLDHLLFVLALVLLVPGLPRLVGTITAFTLAHSLTLAVATFGLVHIPGPPVEACVALSIVFVAAEVAKRGQGTPGLTERSPWVVSFAFGLLHGLGFAGALTDLGLPRSEVPAALLWFNVGVELGQIVFVLLVLSLGWSYRVLEIRWPSWLRQAPAYTIGTCGAYWLLQRIAVMLTLR